MKGAERIYVYPEFTHSCTERGKDDVGYVREDLVDELVEAVEEVLCISDRQHDAWDEARTALAKIKERRNERSQFLRAKKK